MRNTRGINKVIGKTESGDFYICEDIFKYEDNFHGSTGLILCPVSREEYEDAENPSSPTTRDRFLELWKDLAGQGATYKGFEEWLAMILATDFPDCSFDVGGCEFWDAIRKLEPGLTEENYPIFDCVGCGRIFSANMKFEKIYEPKILKQIFKSELGTA
jgi:hypothetical protein